MRRAPEVLWGVPSSFLGVESLARVEEYNSVAWSAFRLPSTTPFLVPTQTVLAPGLDSEIPGF